MGRCLPQHMHFVPYRLDDISYAYAEHIASGTVLRKGQVVCSHHNLSQKLRQAFTILHKDISTSSSRALTQDLSLTQIPTRTVTHSV